MDTADKAVPSSGYVDSIDGLRAVAVLLVLIFHADFAWMSGGFIGVDVFFVISGFLITRNILGEIDRETWSFWDFYRRRIARLLPALFATILVSFVAAWIILSPGDLRAFSKSAVAAAMSWSNILFWMESGYFEQAGETKALLHTWSLGVEEQFYLVWPLILFAIYRGGRGVVSLCLFLMGAISLAAAWYFQPSYPGAVFFLTPFRVFQFAAGGLVAILVPLRAGQSRDILAAVAVSVLVAVAMLVDGKEQNVFLTMLLPAVASAAFIVGARGRFTEAVFASAPAKWIGQRSYSIYLAHWPLFVFWRMSTDYEFSALEGVLAILLAVGLGAILHATVEQRFRVRRSTPSARQKVSYAAAGGGFLACLFFGPLFIKVMPAWPVGDGIESSASVEAGHPAGGANVAVEDNKRCFMRAQDEPDEYGIQRCATPDRNFDGDRTFLVLGDSYAGDSFIVMRNAYPDAFFGYFVVPGCPLPSLEDARDPGRRRCYQHYNHLIENVLPNVDVDGVFLVSNWEEVLDEDLESWIDLLQSSGFEVGLIGGRPTFRGRVPEILKRYPDPYTRRVRLDQLMEVDQRERSKELKVAMSERGIPFADLYAAACGRGCEVIDPEGQIAYKGERHLTVEGSVWIGRRLGDLQPDLLEGFEE